MPTPTSLWFQVEQEIATLLLDRLESGQLAPERAVEIAKYVVHTIPHEMSDQEMMAIIPKLDDQFYELAGIIYKHLSPTIESESQHQLNLLNNRIKSYLSQKKTNLPKNG